MKSDVYISLEENDSHLLVRGELHLLEKLLRSLRAGHTELHPVVNEQEDRNGTDRRGDDEER